jgi:NAD(P)H-hydrate epimerase
MQAIDRWAIEHEGVPGIDLMERAGMGVARAVEDLSAAGPVAVVCGKGNNGGDGLVAARLLREAGREVSVLCTGALSEYRGDAHVNLERLPGPAPLEHAFADASSTAATAQLEGSRVLVDALLGTGFEGVPRGEVAQAIGALDRAAAPVVSVDVPSGVVASTGVVAGEAVRAAVTVTFHLAKPGHWIAPGKWLTGELRTIDIGIPRGAFRATAGPASERAEADRDVLGLIEAEVVRELPRRTPASTKFTSGHVLVVGGSRNLTGAPRMTAHAAIRAGAGYVTACVPASLQALVAGSLTPEVMTRGLPDDEGSLTEGGVAPVLEAGSRGGSLALGTGLGRGEGASALVRALARQVPVPFVLDADGLGAYAGGPEDLRQRGAPAVLTPHAGELGRLLEAPSAEVERERLRHARAAAERTRAIVVLKGDDTIVADPGGLVAVSRGASPALASAGTGDVLTGVIAALLATGTDPFTAAAAGVWLHAEAGRVATLRQGVAEGVIATDVIAALPAARRRGDEFDDLERDCTGFPDYER